jgi:hypothetical protein
VFQMFHTYVASVFIWMLHMFVMATHVFCKCYRCMLLVFQLFRTYVVSVLSGYCKNRSGVAHVAIGPICRSRLLRLLGDVQLARARCRVGTYRRVRKRVQAWGPRGGASKKTGGADSISLARGAPSNAIALDRMSR